MGKQSGLLLDYETADRITAAVLKDHLDRLEKEVRRHLKKGEWMHPEDLIESQTRLIPALKILVKYFGD